MEDKKSKYLKNIIEKLMRKNVPSYELEDQIVGTPQLRSMKIEETRISYIQHFL